MKKYLLLLTIVTLIGCNDSDNEKKPGENTDSLNTELNDALLEDGDRRSKNEDTIQSKFITLIFEPTTKDNFDKADSTSFITKDSVGISKNGSKWMLKLTNGEEKNIFSNDTTNDGDLYQVYTFIGNIPVAGQFLFHAAYYESDNFVLVDKVSGNTVSLLGYPSISPSKKFLVSGASDLVSGQDDNGIDVFQITNKSIEELATIDLMTRGPIDFRWNNDSTIVVTENYLQGTDELERYSKVHLKLNDK